MKYSIMLMHGSTKSFTRKMLKSSSGSFARRSTYTKAARPTTKRAARATSMAVIAAFSSTWFMKVTRAIIVIINSAAPGTSMRNCLARCSCTLRYFSARMNRMAPMGTLIRKIYCQPSAWVTKPPTMGPRMLPTATVEPMYPMARPRSLTGNAWKMMAPLMLNIIAPPTAWIMRKPMSMGRLVLRPQASELTVNRPIPAVNIGTRPVKSDTLPQMSSRLVIVRR